jgi:hypothetical protein
MAGMLSVAHAGELAALSDRYPPHVDFEFFDHIDADPEAVAEALLDKRFQASLSDLPALEERKVLSQKKGKDGRIHRRTRCVLHIDISGVAKKFIGDADPAWVEDATWHPEDMTWEWDIEPEIAKDMLEASGTIEIKNAKKGTQRVVRGKVVVKVPLYGGKVEGWILEGLKQSYAEEAERLSEWLT